MEEDGSVKTVNRRDERADSKQDEEREENWLGGILRKFLNYAQLLHMGREKERGKKG